MASVAKPLDGQTELGRITVDVVCADSTTRTAELAVLWTDEGAGADGRVYGTVRCLLIGIRGRP